MDKIVLNIHRWFFIFISIAVLIFANQVSANSFTYTYNELNRLIKGKYPNGTVIEYTYDKAGNREELPYQAYPPVDEA